MQFNEWIEKNGYTRKWVAEKLDIPTIRLHRILHKEVDPTLAEVLQIETLTRRKVRMEDFIIALQNQPKEKPQHG